MSIVAIPAGIGHVIGITIRQSMRRKKFDAAVALAKRSEALFVYPIMVNTRLRQFENQVAPGLVMGSFDDVGVEFFANLAVVLGSISAAEPSTLTASEVALRQALTDEKYVANRRRRIPDEFTGGLAVYLFDLMIEGRKLMGGRLKSPRILCMGEPGDRGQIFNIPYHTIDVPIPPAVPNAQQIPQDPHISDQCFALVESAGAPVGADHPIHAVVDDVAAPCPRCHVPLVTLLAVRLDAPEFRSIVERNPGLGLSTLRVVACEQCSPECLQTFASFGPTGEPVAESICVRDDVNNQEFRAAPGILPSSPKPRWTRDALRLDPIPRPATAAIDRTIASSSTLGGFPRWTQDPEPPPCRVCNRTMPFVAQVNEFELGDGGVDLFAFWCPGCSTTAVIPQQS